MKILACLVGLRAESDSARAEIAIQDFNSILHKCLCNYMTQLYCMYLQEKLYTYTYVDLYVFVSVSEITKVLIV